MTVVVNDTDFTLYVGDVREVLATMPDESVHCVVTSPPYWGLRDYGTGSWDGGDADCDHVKTAPMTPPDRYTPGGAYVFDPDGRLFVDVCGKCGARRVDKQLGLEPTPDEYVANMVAVFREVRRVLRRDGTCWLNIGDTYNSRLNGSHGGWNGSSPEPQRTMNDGASVSISAPGLKPKDIVGIPWRLAFALQADGWYLRSDIIWSKPNPMPESVTDRPTKAHEYLFLLTRSPRYFYDADAIREPHQDKQGLERLNGSGGSTPEYEPNHQGWVDGGGFKMRPGGREYNSAGRNRRSVWEIATEPYPDAHFATFPQALVEPCVLAGTSERGCCPECGAPWERETEKGEPILNAWSANGAAQYDDSIGGMRSASLAEGSTLKHVVPTKTTGWYPTCVHDHEPVPATVLDPFMGSGTTAIVARRLGRKSIGIELNAEYASLAARRLQQLSLLA